MSREDLTPSAYAVLGLLAREPGSGYELGSRTARSIAHFWPLTRTHIYHELARLEGLGYVTGAEVAQSGLPDKRVYTLTPEGARVLDAWLNDPEPGVQRPRHPMLLKLFFAERAAPERVVEMLARYRADAGARRDRFAAVVAGMDPGPDSPLRFVRAAALFGLRRAEADLAWLDELPAALDLPPLPAHAPPGGPSRPRRRSRTVPPPSGLAGPAPGRVES
ncbi:MAG TPA: PadR family transcriptional regulator [Chloroflexota bacterium]|jgi:DNA-binding PadR family transcriptional regulator|nr:PadR family transcriptional regulator [Chloroflexota bacterium]